MGFLFQLLLPVFGFVFILSATAGQDQRGTEFMLSFIDPQKNEGFPILLISAENRAFVTITIPSLDLILMNDIEPGETWKPTLSTDLRYTSYFTTVRSAVNVTSTSPVTVYVYDGFGLRSSGYMALPLHALSTSYIAVTYNGRTDNAYPVLLLVAIMNDTTVDVLYRLSSGQCDEHTTGQTSTHTLHAYDVHGVRCTGDFTGTYVVSNKALVVISGHQKTNVSGLNMDTLQEMLIPVDQFGLSFVLIEPHGNARGSINRIVSSSDNTAVTSSTGETFLPSAYEYVDIDTDISGQQCINSNFPVLVVSFTKSANGEKFDERSMDAAMYTVPATNMFTTSIYVDYGLTSVLATDEFVSIAFVFSRNDTPDFSASPTVHEVIPSCPYDVYKMTVTAWPVVYSEGSLKFGAYLLGSTHNKFNGAAFPLNMRFGNKQVSSSSSSYQSSSSSCCFPSSPLTFSSSSSFPLSSSSSSFTSLSSLMSSSSSNSPSHFSFPFSSLFSSSSSLSPSSPPSSSPAPSPMFCDGSGNSEDMSNDCNYIYEGAKHLK
ncbi:uncharacterized protein LOC124286563 [Haliotis rubra]|uniref:uncharacterized protein LOC124286563 n=1 Tax=Haliotis rubra TaxID=36100 RepID=UPI001EE54D81|nr:uncharacterized protein LOC124286563 [Haliotis rubra]